MQSRNKEVARGNLKKSTNATYGIDVQYAIETNKWLLKPLGLWPMSHESGSFEKNFSRLLIVACSFVLGFLLLSGSLYTFTKEKNSKVRLKLVGVLSFCVMAIFKYGSLAMSRRSIGRCIEHLVDDWRAVGRPDDRSIMLNYALFGRYGATICTGFMYGGGFFYAGVMPLLTGTITVPEFNVSIRPLPYPGYFAFFDPQVSPIYEMVFLNHCCCAFVMHSTAAASCSLAVVFAMHACGQLEVLMSWLNELIDDTGNGQSGIGDSVETRFAAIVARHVRALSFILSTEKLLCNICLVELVGSTLNLCLLGFDLLTEWEHSGPVAMATYVILITSFIFNIFMYCCIGEVLTAECRKFGEKTYMIEWYRLPSKTALGLTLIIATADNPTTITAGRLMELSLKTFCDVIKTAIGYLNILRTLTA